jgi:AraC-like DNA-binding protein
MALDVKSTLNRKIIDLRELGFRDLQILGKYSYNKTEEKLDEHFHPGMIEICYCDKGSQYFVVNNKQHFIKGGDVFIHFPGEVHGSGEHPENKGLLYWMIISMDLTSSHIISLCKLLINNRKRHFKANKAVKRKLEEIFEAYSGEESTEIKNLRINVLTEAFLLNLLDSTNKNDTAEANNNRLRRVLDFIDANLTEDISISLLANEMNLSESRFKILFKDLMGFTPSDYIQRKRVEIAIERLSKDQTISFTDLAYDLNFSSLQYFSTVVKKYTGKSPGEIRSDNSK